jgi:hypothetical protein
MDVIVGKEWKEKPMDDLNTKDQRKWMERKKEEEERNNEIAFDNGKSVSISIRNILKRYEHAR